MVTQDSSAVDVLVLRRTYSTSRDVLFDVWTQPEHLKKWMGPSYDYEVPVAEVDLKVGGQYKMAFVHKEGKEAVVAGTFQEIIKPEKLVYTWTWQEPNENAGIETLVTVEFIEKDKGTELVLTHQRFGSEEMRLDHSKGWMGCFDKLEDYLKN